MNRILFLFSALLLGFTASAQTQQGFVKTKGRMVNGQLVPGQGLKGATVSVQGRTTVLVKADDGAFSFPMPDAQFRLDSVRKNGYQLVDMDACPRTYKRSCNPLYIVMETPEQQLQDQLAAERKIRRNLQKQLQEKEDQIEALLEENKITNEEYQKALETIYAEQQSNERLIAEMAKRYSELDYDQLDEFYRQVSLCIENGELTKADSLLRSRGDLNKQVESLLQQGQAIQEEKEQLQKAESVHQAEVQEAAQRCQHFYETFYLQHMNDSAVHYLALRAHLDSTCVEWQNDAGKATVEFLHDYDRALPYYQTALRQAKLQYGDDSEWMATIDENMGMIHYYQKDYEKALEYFHKALDIRIALLFENHPDVAEVYNSIGLIYANTDELSQALEYFTKALQIRQKAFGEVHSDVAVSYNNIGYIHYAQKDYHKALEYYNKALEIKKQTLNDDDPSFAMTYLNIGTLYFLLYKFEKSLYYLNLAYEINKASLGEKHPNTIQSKELLDAIQSALKD